MWTGFYAGVNLGGGWGTSNNAYNAAVPISDGTADGVNLVKATVSALYPVTGSGMPWGTTALANTGVANVNQSGFIGGGQVGYNFQWGDSFVVGGEADIQGTTIRGQGNYASGSAGNSAFQAAVSQLGSSNYAFNTVGSGSGNISGGIDWLGTVRGRLGYLVTPSILLYGTGGLAYGGTHASAASTLLYQVNGLVTLAGSSVPVVNSSATAVSTPSIGNYSGTRVGWTVGGGGEWLFSPNWSVKVEALYYNLGDAKFHSSPIAVVSPTGEITPVNATATRVSFAGVIARAGVNYHFNWFAPTPVAASY
jgi:outer membrane immunogenic protein